MLPTTIKQASAFTFPKQPNNMTKKRTSAQMSFLFSPKGIAIPSVL